MGIPNVQLPADPIQGLPSYEAALAAFEALPSVTIPFDNGAGAAPGAPVPAFTSAYPSFPLPGTQARSWYLGPNGTLTDAPSTTAAAGAFTWNPKARSATSFTGNTASGPGGLWTATPTYHWEPNPPGTALAYVTEPLAADTTVVGQGSVDAWMTASVPDVDLQVSVSEVRPDGTESFVQNGWLRASKRALAKGSTELEPVLTLARKDAAPLPSGRWTKVTIPLYYQGHVYRAGSRLRVVVTAPGGDQPVWAFAETMPASGTAEVSLATGADRPSRVVLPVIAGAGAQGTALPPCPALRAEACRPYVPLENRAVAP